MPRVLLIRHGQAMVGTDDYDRLSKLGQRQSLLLARALADRGVRPRVILSGALKRQQETAGILRDVLNVDRPGADLPTMNAPGADLPGAEWPGAEWPGAEWPGADLPGGIDPRWNEFDYRGVIVAARPDYADRAVQRADLARYPDPVAAFHRVFTAATARWMSGTHDTEYVEPFPVFLARVQAALTATLAPLGPDELALVVTSTGVISTLAAELLAGGTPTWQRINACLANTGISSVVAGSAPQLLTLNDHTHLDIGEPELLTYR